MVYVGDTGDLTEHDANVTEFDYTLYTSVMCSESLRYYWMTYENLNMKSIGFEDMKEESRARQFGF